MADIKKDNISPTNQKMFGGAQYGNATKLEFHLESNSSGVILNSDTATAAQIADVIVLGLVQAGTRLLDSLAIISNAFTAAATGDIGFRYADGVDDSGVPEDDDYFNNNLDLATAGRTRAANTAVTPVTLPKDAHIILTLAGAALDEVGVLDLVLDVELKGAP